MEESHGDESAERSNPGGSNLDVSTADLLEELDRGDSLAGREMMESYRSRLLVRATQHPWMRAVAKTTTPEDVLQEVFLRALHSGLCSRREGRAPGSMHRALQVVLDRVLADHLRRLGSAKHGAGVSMISISPSAEDTGSPLLSRLASSSATPTVSARSAELIRLCQSHLGDGEWEVWRLRVVAGLGFDEIAALVEATSASVRGVMHRARKKLILALAELDPDLESS
jgi:DNA-directed RNA polymerase specialized sigma24 family protein